MSGLISKRQQARNEKVLQDLVHSVPGNNVCADCGVRNPSWASWNLGIFLCMRCAAIHRKLGTHISKVKSLSMDSWTNEQVENMKKTGNAASNKQYNPKNKKPPVPVDADEADGAMERFIRAKYAQTSSPGGATRRNGAGRSDDSDEGTPPPLPPKTGGRFGFAKSNSSTFPISFRSSKKESRSGPSSPHGFSSERSPNHLSNKPSKVFGANVGAETPEATAAKLAQLRDMGFMDDKRNAMILKGVNGSVEKTIEALVRLGEGGGHGSVPPKVPSRESSLPAPRSLTPQRSFDVSPAITGQKAPSAQSPSAVNNNPWDIQPAQPQSSQSTGTIPNNSNPFYTNTVVNTNDPFGLGDVGGQQHLTHSMQNLSLAPPTQQALFPHHTGGVPGPQATGAAMMQQPMTAPISQMQNFSSNLHPQQGYNPFLQSASTQQAQSLALNTSPFQTQSQSQPQSPASYAGNPFLRSPATMTSPLNQIPEQSQQNIYTSPQSPYGNNPFMSATSPFAQGPGAAQQQQHNPFQAAQAQNPFQSQAAQQNPFQTTLQQQSSPQQPQNPWQTQGTHQTQQQNPYQAQQNYYQPQQQQQQQQQYGQPQMAGSYQPQVDKASIMALFGSTNQNTSPFAQQMPQQQQQQAQQQAQQQPQQPHVPQRSVSVPLTSSASSNPFMGGGLAAKAGMGTTGVAGSTAAPGPSAPLPTTIGTGVGSGRSRESMMVEMGWANGRHSPDAFASFSARS
ncbi:uncharacterized protein B0I36DRAFT_152066 [Microdochium trichocladiopsis]|uniref:Arf-GAP domain-containing protein n=1 Tax=Microdochium trichocladiopsis TaxID=1682393 RepID=A0A9P9BQK6_9PEZI|nr:uncharacterized protein B0I36DRAFT_152066 [Microdochium trichocladiopsis]KAH7025977.1 hypothetical protein B0I36DRAFT_152066 [Microdochium trichocladiopsis]